MWKIRGKYCDDDEIYDIKMIIKDKKDVKMVMEDK